MPLTRLPLASADALALDLSPSVSTRSGAWPRAPPSRTRASRGDGRPGTVDLEAIAAAHESARVTLAAATRDQVDAVRTVAALRRLTLSAITAAAARDATVARHDRVQALADLATGSVRTTRSGCG